MHQHVSLLIHPRTASVTALFVAVVAVVIGLTIPRWVPLRFIEEGGVIETITLCAYVVAILGINMMRRAEMSRLDVLAASVVLVAMGAREADLHVAMYGVSILKSRFYLDAPPHQILGALALLAPIVFSIFRLLSRYWWLWLRPHRRWNVAASTMALMIGIVIVAKIFDRAPDVLGLAAHSTTGVLTVMLSLEELLELSLPMFALLVMAQCCAGMTVLDVDAIRLQRQSPEPGVVAADRAASCINRCDRIRLNHQTKPKDAVKLR